jgi:hypothetical protein
MIAAGLLLSAIASAATPASRSNRESVFRTFLQNELKEEHNSVRQISRKDPRLRYSAIFIDLNGDHRDEVIVYVTGQFVCGSGGCDLSIYTPRGRSWRQVTTVSITRPPISVLDSRHRGWRDLSVFVSGGGIRPATWPA